MCAQGLPRVVTDPVEADAVEPALGDQVVDRLERCFQQLRALPVTQAPRAKALIFMTGADFNNAFVYFPIAGSPEQMAEISKRFNKLLTGAKD